MTITFKETVYSILVHMVGGLDGEPNALSAEIINVLADDIDLKHSVEIEPKNRLITELAAKLANEISLTGQLRANLKHAHAIHAGFKRKVAEQRKRVNSLEDAIGKLRKAKEVRVEVPMTMAERDAKRRRDELNHLNWLKAYAFDMHQEFIRRIAEGDPDPVLKTFPARIEAAIARIQEYDAHKSF